MRSFTKLSILNSIVIFILFISCQSSPNEINQNRVVEKLVVTYSGDADMVQFKMFEGIHQLLKKDSINGIFKGVFDILNLKEAIFSYNIIVHKKDSSGKMIEQQPESQFIQLNQKVPTDTDRRFLWIGENRKGDFLKNDTLTGTMQTKMLTSELLNGSRELTIYTPEIVKPNTPHIYFTDGSDVEYYASYVDKLISTGKIIPIKLIGIHASLSNRYQEYVYKVEDNKLFTNHEQFIYNKVIPDIEKEIQNWNGNRYIYGVSNGAAFCMHAGLNHPTVFEEIIAFSTADYISPIAQMLSPITFTNDKYPRFYMGAGRYETIIFSDNIKFLETMKDKNINVEFKEFISGHDSYVWRIEFLEYLEKRFKK